MLGNIYAQPGGVDKLLDILKDPRKAKEVEQYMEDYRDITSPISGTEITTPEGTKVIQRTGRERGKITEPYEAGKQTGAIKRPPTDTMITRERLDTEIRANLDTVKKLYNPSYVGFITGPVKEWISRKAASKTGQTAEQVEFYAALQSIFNTIGKARAGAAWTAPEIARLQKELPSSGMDSMAFEAFVKRFEDSFNSVRSATKEMTKGYAMPISESKEQQISPEAQKIIDSILKGKKGK